MPGAGISRNFGGGKKVRNVSCARLICDTCIYTYIRKTVQLNYTVSSHKQKQLMLNYRKDRATITAARTTAINVASVKYRNANRIMYSP